MYTAIIWGLGYDYHQYINCIKLQEMLGELELVGVTDADELYSCLDGYSFIPIGKIRPDKVDYIIVTSRRYFNEILTTAKRIGFVQDNIIQAKVFALPNFCFSDYIKLVKSHVSIIANNCWGGAISNSLGLPFRSPFINMFEHDDEYIKLLRDVKGYLQKKVVFERMDYTEVLQRYFPICTLGDIKLYFNHYVSMEEVNEKWYRRLARINWDNLFVMMYTDSREIAEMFDSLEHLKKICFVPFQCNLKSAYTLELAGKVNLPLWEIVNKIAGNYLADYDLIELLNSGTIKQNRYFMRNFINKSRGGAV